MRKILEIQHAERDLAGLLAKTPYILLLSWPGINVVSAAEFAGEMGSIKNYANPKAITGRAGIFPSRSQSDQVDNANGPLVRSANRRLRCAIIMIADNLIKCNAYFNAKAKLWKAAGKDPRHSRVRVASRFTRIAYHMVANQEVFDHPCCQERSYILDKLVQFHREHLTPSGQINTDLHHAAKQLPTKARKNESDTLKQYLTKPRVAAGRDPQALGQLLPKLLAELAQRIQSRESGGADPCQS